jgi:hypothetical protein
MNFITKNIASIRSLSSINQVIINYKNTDANIRGEGAVENVKNIVKYFLENI